MSDDVAEAWPRATALRAKSRSVLQRSSNRMTVRCFWMVLGDVAVLHSLLFLALYVTR